MTSALTPSFVFQYEKRMRVIQEEEYARSLLAENNWWSRVAKTVEFDGASDRITWFLQTAKIEPVGDGGNLPFTQMVTQSLEVVPARYGSAIKQSKDKLLDARGGGLDALAEWSRQVGTATAYFPQQLMAELLMNGAATDGSANAYDGVPFFSDASNLHPYNPYMPALGGYANWLHGAASGSYPGALPIDESVSVDVALKNLGKAIAYMRGWKMPDGRTPRFLTPAAIICAPALTSRVAQLLDAKYIAQAASSGGGSGDIVAYLRRWGLADPIEAAELASTTNYSTIVQFAKTDGSGQKVAYPITVQGNDTSWYLVMKQNQTSQLGGLLHALREPFRTNYFFGETGMGGATGIDAILNRALDIEYHCQGRVSGQYGHPYAIMRIDAS